MPLPARLKKLIDSWATRSLMVGAASTTVDLSVGLTVITLFPTQTRAAGLCGLLVGSTFSYFANKRFAFHDEGKVRASAWRYVLMTVVLSLVHAQVLVLYRDRLGIPYAIAKMMADVSVFTFTNLVLLRYFVFAKKKDEAPRPPEPPAP